MKVFSPLSGVLCCVLLGWLGAAGVVYATPKLNNNVVQVQLGHLAPTQSVVAHEQIAIKLAQYQRDPTVLYHDLCQTAGRGALVAFSDTSSPQQSNSYQCEYPQTASANLNALPTVVQSPSGQLYLTDGHHTLSAWYDLPDGGAEMIISAHVVKVYTAMAPQQFWQQMQQEGNTWLYDSEGRAITYAALPKQLGRASLQNDPFRAAMFFLRGGVWQKPTPAIPFVEFYWAQHLKAQPALQFPGYQDAVDYVRWLDRINDYLAHLAADTPIYGTFTAQQLGLVAGNPPTITARLLCDDTSDLAGLGLLGLALQQRGMQVTCPH